MISHSWSFIQIISIQTVNVKRIFHCTIKYKYDNKLRLNSHLTLTTHSHYFVILLRLSLSHILYSEEYNTCKVADMNMSWSPFELNAIGSTKNRYQCLIKSKPRNKGLTFYKLIEYCNQRKWCSVLATYCNKSSLSESSLHTFQWC